MMPGGPASNSRSREWIAAVRGALLLAIVIGVSSASRQFGSALESIPSKEPYRVLFTGDSIVRGLLIPIVQKRFTTRVIRSLADRYKREFSEVNQGESNWALVQKHNSHLEKSKTTLGRVLSRSFNGSSAIVVEWGVNDHLYGYQEDEFTYCYYALLNDLREAFPNTPLVLMTTVPDFRFPNKHIRKTQADRAWVDGSDPLWSERVHAAFHELAVHFECHIAQIHRTFDHSKELLIDKVHPTSSGHRVIADTILSAVEEPHLSRQNVRLVSDIHFLSEITFFGMRISPLSKALEVQQQKWFQIWALNPELGFWIETAVSLKLSIPRWWWKQGETIGIKVFLWGKAVNVSSLLLPSLSDLAAVHPSYEVKEVGGLEGEILVEVRVESFTRQPSTVGYSQRTPPRDSRTNANINSTRHMVEYFFIEIDCPRGSSEPLRFSATTTNHSSISGGRVMKPSHNIPTLLTHTGRPTNAIVSPNLNIANAYHRPTGVINPTLQIYFAKQDIHVVYNELFVEAACVSVLFLLSTWAYWRRRRRISRQITTKPEFAE